MKTMNTGKRRNTGYSLIEVLIGIVIFAVGIMAIAQFQGKLSKSSADSTARTIASNVAEEEIERLRSFSQVAATGNPDFPGFGDIVSSDPDATPVVRTRGNIDYTVETVVTDFYYNPAIEEFQPTKPDPNIVNPDLKRVEVTVSWGAGDNTPLFSVDASQDAVDLGSGSVTLVDLISSFTTGSGAKVRLNNAAVGL
jgi:type IV pilus modification protein PilV